MPRRRSFSLACIALAALWATSCASDAGADRPAPAAPPAPTEAPANPPATAPPADVDAKPQRELRLVLTTDEHGWLSPLDEEEKGRRVGGILELYSDLVRTQAVGRSDVLLLSAGDNWTGPFESTVLEGAPMVAAFNQMGYAATAVGNHEFDFGTGTLKTRADEAKYPFLAANVREAATGEIPVWAKPFTIVDTGKLKVGLIGLTFAEAHTVTDAKNLVGLEFTAYEDALRQTAPKVRAAGAEFLVVLLHDRMTEAQRLLPLLRELNIGVVAAGHVHTPGLVVDDNGTPTISDDVAICNAGAFMRTYCVVNVALEGETITVLQAKINRVENPIDAKVEDPDPALSAIVDAAMKNADRLGGEVLAVAPAPIRRKGDALSQLVVDTWLAAIPYADVAINNRGGLRQDLQRGKVRVRDVRGVLPFNNTLVVVDMTGAQLREVLKNPEGVVAGIKYSYQVAEDGSHIVRTLHRASGAEIGDDERLKVIVNDFMYRGGDRFVLRSVDREPEETALDWREPLLRHLRALTAAKKKLEHKADDRALEVNR